MYIDKHFTTFVKLVSAQFVYGAKKYGAKEEGREATDILFDKHGKNWIIGTIDKYCFRFSNVAREKDLLKIACYMYLFWLKRGFFVKDSGLAEALDTNIKIKTEKYEEFVEKATKLYMFGKKHLDEIENPIMAISNELGKWSKGQFKDISEGDICVVFCLSYIIWFNNFKTNKVRDTDTYNSLDRQPNENNTL